MAWYGIPDIEGKVNESAEGPREGPNFTGESEIRIILSNITIEDAQQGLEGGDLCPLAWTPQSIICRRAYLQACRVNACLHKTLGQTSRDLRNNNLEVRNSLTQDLAL